MDTPLTPEQVALQEQQTLHEDYLHRLAVSCDQFMNVVTDGLPDETISSRAQRMSEQGNEFATLLIKVLDIIEKQHGEKAQVGDATRAEVVKEIEGNG